MNTPEKVAKEIRKCMEVINNALPGTTSDDYRTAIAHRELVHEHTERMYCLSNQYNSMYTNQQELELE